MKEVLKLLPLQDLSVWKAAMERMGKQHAVFSLNFLQEYIPLKPQQIVLNEKLH